MNFEEAKEIFLNRGYEQVEGGSIYNPDKWRESVIVISDWLRQEPCDDVISRQAVLDLIEHYNSDGLGSVFYGYQEGIKFADAVNKLPQVTPQPKIGHWKYIGNGHNGLFECDNCGAHRNMFDELEKHCYDCGAKMQG